MKRRHLWMAAAFWLSAIDIVLLNPNVNAGDSVVCRRAKIAGFDACYDKAEPLVGANTSDIDEMKIYITAYRGNLYAHSNFKTPGADYPTKLATTSRIDALNLAYNLVGKGFVSQDALENALDNKITFIVDKEALRSAGISVDFTGANRVLSVAEYERAVRTKADIRIAEAQAAAERLRKVQEEREQEALLKRQQKEAAFLEDVRREERFEQTIATYRSEIRGELAKLSTKDMHLFSVMSHASGVEIQTEHGSLFLFADDLEQMKTGKALDPDHPLTKLLDNDKEGSFVLYTGESVEQGIESKADDIAFLLQKAYPNRRVYRDPFSANTPALVKGLNTFSVSSPEKFVTLVAGDSFETTDWNIVQNIIPTLQKRGFTSNRVLERGKVPNWDGKGDNAVTVITGHIDEKLAAFIQEMGKAGYFRDNLVLLNTCRETPTRALASTIGSAYGARGVFCYDSKITAANVEDFVLGLADAVKNAPSKPLVELINENIGRHGLNGVWTLCQESERTRGYFICYLDHITDR